MKDRDDTIDGRFFLPDTTQATQVEKRLEDVRADFLRDADNAELWSVIVRLTRLTFVPVRARWSSKTLIRTAMASAFCSTSNRGGLVERCLIAFKMVVKHDEVKDPHARKSPVKGEVRMSESSSESGRLRPYSRLMKLLVPRASRIRESACAV